MDRVTKKAALGSRRVSIARWYLDGRSLAISAFVMRRRINSLRGHEDLIHRKITKATKTEGFFTEGNEGPAGPSTFNNRSLASARTLYFVAFASLL
jgi:hypothetical protein